ncbi:MAG: glycine zipper 2TM domain-containing protein [Chromatiaceae bacterium]|nr:glycine zipper 2TM domain-containing protein [Chromatiaceae bacterium]MCP5422555.1 glycine zipper 2TM domain-containing protein [Chromatiaceae bacterium]
MYPSKLAINIVVASVLVLSGCESTREQQGNVIGAIAGGVLGSKIGKGTGSVAATIAGTLIGGYIGGNIGRQMDDSDRYRAGQALESTPTNQSSSWRNPDTGSAYEVTPTRTYYSNDRPCREYTTEAWIDGKRETVYGTACRQSDGSWLASN